MQGMGDIDNCRDKALETVKYYSYLIAIVR